MQEEVLEISPAVSNTAKANDVVPTYSHEPVSKQAKTSNEATSMHKEVPDVVVVFSANFDHFDNAYVCLINDVVDERFIKRLKALPIIFNNYVLDLSKMDERTLKNI